MDGESAIQYVLDNNIDGSLVECGVQSGKHEKIWIECLNRYNMERDIYLFDTFTGLPMPGEKDYNCPGVNWLPTTNDVLNVWNSYATDSNVNKWCYAPLEEVKNNLEGLGYNNSKLHYIVGNVMETLNNNTNIPEQIALLRLDTDWYDSSKFELVKLYPKVVKGGLIILDDYWFWNGQHQATNEYFEEIGIKPDFLRVNSQTACIIKH